MADQVCIPMRELTFHASTPTSRYPAGLYANGPVPPMTIIMQNRPPSEQQQCITQRSPTVAAESPVQITRLRLSRTPLPQMGTSSFGRHKRALVSPHDSLPLQSSVVDMTGRSMETSTVSALRTPFTPVKPVANHSQPTMNTVVQSVGASDNPASPQHRRVLSRGERRSPSIDSGHGTHYQPQYPSPTISSDSSVGAAIFSLSSGSPESGHHESNTVAVNKAYVYSSSSDGGEGEPNTYQTHSDESERRRVRQPRQRLCNSFPKVCSARHGVRPKNPSSSQIAETVTLGKRTRRMIRTHELPRLVIPQPPWTDRDLLNALKFGSGSATQLAGRLTVETLQKVGMLLQRPLVRVALQMQRLSLSGLCGTAEVHAAVGMVMSEPVANACLSFAARALHRFSSNITTERSLSERAVLSLCVGAFQRWIHEQHVVMLADIEAVVTMTAVFEALLHEVIARALGFLASDKSVVDPTAFMSAVRRSVDLWGLLLSCENLVCGRLPDGCVRISQIATATPLRKEIAETLTLTSVESSAALSGMVSAILETWSSSSGSPWTASEEAVKLIYSQMANLEPNSLSSNQTPPLGEWLRVCRASAEFRGRATIEPTDVSHAMKLFVPFASRMPAFQSVNAVDAGGVDINANDEDHLHSVQHKFGFGLIGAGRTEFVGQAIQLIGGVDQYDKRSGLTPLMLACRAGNVEVVGQLLQMGASVDQLVYQVAEFSPHQRHLIGWTALNFAVLSKSSTIVQILLSLGACPNGSGCLSALQLAVLTGNQKIVEQLLEAGGDPFYTSQQSPFPPALALAVQLDQRNVFSQLVSSSEIIPHPVSPQLESSPTDNVYVTIDERLLHDAARFHQIRLPPRQDSVLQLALYLAVENQHMDLAMECRKLGAQWNAHTWYSAMNIACDKRFKEIVSRLLADVWCLQLKSLPTDSLRRIISLMLDLLRLDEQDNVIGDSVAYVLTQIFGPEPIPPVKAFRKRPSAAMAVSNLFLVTSHFNYNCNREALCEISSKLSGIITTTMDNKGIVDCTQQPDLCDLQPEIIEAVLQFAHHRDIPTNVQKDWKRLLKLLKCANHLEIYDLGRLCEVHISRLLTCTNCVKIFQVAKKLSAIELEAYCEAFMLQKLRHLHQKTDFRQLLNRRTSLSEALLSRMLEKLTFRKQGSTQTSGEQLIVEVHPQPQPGIDTNFL